VFFLSFSSYISYIITKSISYIVCNSVYDSITDDELHYVDFFFQSLGLVSSDFGAIHSVGIAF